MTRGIRLSHVGDYLNITILYELPYLVLFYSDHNRPLFDVILREMTGCDLENHRWPQIM